MLALNAKYEEEWRGVGRAVGGAVVFNLPLMMTMEMWWLAYYVPPERLTALLLLSLPLFFGVSRVIGFKEERNAADNLVDVLVAYVFGFAISAITLLLFNTLRFDTPGDVALNAITLQAIPATLGALLGRSEIGSGNHDPAREKQPADEIVVLAVGALFLGLTVAPTEEIVLLARQMTHWHSLGLFIATLVVMLIFAIACSYIDRSKHTNVLQLINSYARFCGIAYLVSLVVSLLLLWVFGQFETMKVEELLAILVALVFPSGVGAAAAKIII